MSNISIGGWGRRKCLDWDRNGKGIAQTNVTDSNSCPHVYTCRNSGNVLHGIIIFTVQQFLVTLSTHPGRNGGKQDREMNAKTQFIEEVFYFKLLPCWVGGIAEKGRIICQQPPKGHRNFRLWLPQGLQHPSLPPRPIIRQTVFRHRRANTAT